MTQVHTTHTSGKERKCVEFAFVHCVCVRVFFFKPAHLV